jgi:hypothetical protein
MPRSLIFFSAAANWLSYLPISFMATIFFDFLPRDARNSVRIKRERKRSPILTILGPFACAKAMRIPI